MGGILAVMDEVQILFDAMHGFNIGAALHTMLEIWQGKKGSTTDLDFILFADHDHVSNNSGWTECSRGHRRHG